MRSTQNSLYRCLGCCSVLTIQTPSHRHYPTTPQLLSYRLPTYLQSIGVGELETPFLLSEDLQMFERMEMTPPLLVGSPITSSIPIGVKNSTYATASAVIRIEELRSDDSVTSSLIFR